MTATVKAMMRLPMRTAQTIAFVFFSILIMLPKVWLMSSRAQAAQQMLTPPIVEHKFSPAHIFNPVSAGYARQKLVMSERCRAVEGGGNRREALSISQYFTNTHSPLTKQIQPDDWGRISVGCRIFSRRKRSTPPRVLRFLLPVAA